MRTRWTWMILAVVVPLAGCAGGAQMSNMWNDAAFTARPLHDVFVVAVRKDAARRRLWEDAFVSELKARGVNATASYTLFDAVPDTDQVISAVRERNFGAVLASARLTPTEETTIVPGYVRQEPELRYNPWTNRYHTYLRNVLVPEQVETTRIQRFQTDIWSTGEGGHLVWSGTLNVSESPDKGIIQRDVSSGIVPELEKVGLVPKRS